ASAGSGCTFLTLSDREENTAENRQLCRAGIGTDASRALMISALMIGAQQDDPRNSAPTCAQRCPHLCPHLCHSAAVPPTCAQKCHLPVPTSATHLCPPVPPTCAHPPVQCCQSVPPVSAQGLCQSVPPVMPRSDASQC
ncbi:unnamed protein product, partial [Staurois parvus]